jgi:gas vesicle protein
MQGPSNFMTGLMVGSAMGAMAALLWARQVGAIERRPGPHTTDDVVDDEVEQSFPASDPPSWTPATSSIISPSGSNS